MLGLKRPESAIRNMLNEYSVMLQARLEGNRCRNCTLSDVPSWIVTRGEGGAAAPSPLSWFPGPSEAADTLEQPAVLRSMSHIAP